MMGTDLLGKGKVFQEAPLTWWAELPQTGPGGERGQDGHEVSVPSPLKKLKALQPVSCDVQLLMDGRVL